MDAIQQRIFNIRENCTHHEGRINRTGNITIEPVQLICYGPSLRDTWKEIDPQKCIVTTSGANDFLRFFGITPHYHVEFDWRVHKAGLVNNIGDTQFLLASCVNPNLCKKLPNIALWHADQTPAEAEAIKELEPEATLIQGGSSAGLRAIELFYWLGFRRFEIHGMDSSFRDEKWAGPHKDKVRRVTIDISVKGRSFKTSLAFLHYATEFGYLRRRYPGLKMRLHGDGLLQTMMEKISDVPRSSHSC